MPGQGAIAEFVRRSAGLESLMVPAVGKRPIPLELVATGVDGERGFDVCPRHVSMPIHVPVGHGVRDTLVAKLAHQPIENRRSVMVLDCCNQASVDCIMPEIVDAGIAAGDCRRWQFLSLYAATVVSARISAPTGTTPVSAPLAGGPPAAFRSDLVGMKTRFVGILATPAGFEPATPSLEGRGSASIFKAHSDNSRFVPPLTPLWNLRQSEWSVVTLGLAKRPQLHGPGHDLAASTLDVAGKNLRRFLTAQGADLGAGQIRAAEFGNATLP